MMIHVVLCIDDASRGRIRARLEELNYPRFYLMEDRVCLVSCHKLARELAAELEIGNNEEKGLVLAAVNYWGFTDSELSYWLRGTHHDD